jgi:hypothetical protein
MGYERYPRGTNPQDDYYGRSETQDYGRDYGSGRYGSYSSARDYRAAGTFDRDGGRDRYGARDTDGRRDAYGQRDDDGRRDSYGRQGSDDRGGYGRRPETYGASRYGQDDGYRGSYASDGRRFNDVGAHRHDDDDDRGTRDHGRHRDRGANYGRQPQGYDYDDRGFLARAGDEVRSWFGDEDAERRREADSRYDDRYYQQQGGRDRDGDYHSWRSGQIAALDRDYDEYRQENRSRFENEFSTFRSERQTQRAALDKVKEHDEVLGSDGSHVGTVDKVRGDRILLTRNDVDAGGQHHSIPSRWIQSVDDKKVTLSKTADEAKRHWRNEEESQAMFGYGDRNRGTSAQASGGATGTNHGSSASSSSTAGSTTSGSPQKDTNLNSSFSGTY